MEGGLVRVLAFDCSTARGSVAVSVDGAMVFHEEFESPRGRGGQFFPVLRAAVREVGAPDRVAVGVGPGSYNGLRTAVAAAAGLRLASGAELVGVASVRCLALQEGVAGYVAVGDARGGSVFIARVRERRIVGELELVARETLEARLAGMERDGFATVLAVGTLGDFEVRTPDAGVLAEIAVGEVGGAEVAPLYLKPACVTVAKKSRVGSR